MMTIQDILAAQWMQSPLVKGLTYIVGTGLGSIYTDLQEGKQWNDKDVLLKAGASMFIVFKAFTSNPNPPPVT